MNAECGGCCSFGGPQWCWSLPVFPPLESGLAKTCSNVENVAEMMLSQFWVYMLKSPTASTVVLLTCKKSSHSEMSIPGGSSNYVKKTHGGESGTDSYQCRGPRHTTQGERFQPAQTGPAAMLTLCWETSSPHQTRFILQPLEHIIKWWLFQATKFWVYYFVRVDDRNTEVSGTFKTYRMGENLIHLTFAKDQSVELAQLFSLGWGGEG